MVLLDFSEIDVTWLASKLSGAAVSLGAEALEMKNWIIQFGCDSEELREFIADQVDWLSNSPHPWASYRSLVECRIVAHDNLPGVIPVGIGETLQKDLAKLFLSVSGDQEKVS